MTQELVSDEKERAEHLMLVDLGRNDVGRIAEYGTVNVTELMVVERYSHVLHLVSQVDGKLRDGLTAMDAFRAGFPAGTLTGAPKVRAMEIIDEMEPERRGPYGGAVGLHRRRRQADGSRDHDSYMCDREWRRVGAGRGGRRLRLDSRAGIPRTREQGARTSHRDRPGPRRAPHERQGVTGPCPTASPAPTAR